MDQQMETARLRVAINANMCPDCNNWGFHMGPRGGAGRNIFCANPACRSGFNIATVAEVLLVERIEKGRDCYYGPLAHVMSTPLELPNGRELVLPLCVFNCDGIEHWPIGHRLAQNVKEITCPQCAETVRKRWSERHHARTDH